MSDKTSTSSADYVLLTRLADEFAARFRAGERPSLQEYIDRHPALVDEIHELFPAMVEIEQVKEDHQAAAGQAEAPAALAIRQLGDYRILREVGRGGMGIVYEAEQVSLGRRVALKILSTQSLCDPKQKRRFEREARAAGRLHHTNIVPVFGVGEHDSTPYYVMQFIQGLGLEGVLGELRRMKAGADLGTLSATDGPADRNASPGDVTAADIARSLMTGRFVANDRADTEVGSASETAAPHGRGPVPDTELVPSHKDLPSGDGARASDSLSLSSSSVSLLATHQGQGGRRPKAKRPTYWDGVARIGVQVADALEYAHSQGIVHRDVKPSNLLLDARGTAWVADFGLAKVNDHLDLTHTGDVLGTLRYMPPEAFEGRSGVPGDVYSLGLTLYELLALRPAYGEKDRARLVRQVTTEEAERLGRLNPEIPRDLETIVHKAIEHDPSHRYTTAGELAADLQRFLDDEPIEARRLSQAERLVRWSRRHKAVAALLATLGGVLAVGFAVMAVLWSRAEQSATTARLNERAAQNLATEEAKARAEAQEQRRIALEQKQIVVEKAEMLALEDYVNRVNRAFREIQDDNVALAEDLLHGCPPERRGWEWQFVERLCNSERQVLDLGMTSVNALAFSPDGTWVVSGSGYVPHTVTNEIAPLVDVRDVISGQRRTTLPGARGTVLDVAVSPDGKKVAAGCSAGLALVWNVETGQRAWTRSEPGLDTMSLAFSPDGRSLAAGYGRYSEYQVGRVKVWDVVSGKEIKAFSGPRGGVNKVAFHPDGKRLAVAGWELVEVWDLETATKRLDLKGHDKWVYCVAYSPDGKWLATGAWDGTVKLRDAATGEIAQTIFAHGGYVLGLAFSPDSRNLVTASEDRSTRLWEIPSGRRLATFHGHTDFIHAVAFRPDCREVATGSLDGSIRFWDLKTSRPVVVEHTGWPELLAFRRDGLRVVSQGVVYGTDAMFTAGWNPVTGELDAALAGIRFESLPKEFVFVPGSEFSVGNFRSVTSPDGKLIAQTNTSIDARAVLRSKEYAQSSVTVRESKTGKIVHTLTGHSADIASLAFSPDGRRLATASGDRTVKLWDMQTGKDVFTLLGHNAGVVSVVFSPDGNQIVTGGIDCTARVWNATPLASNMSAEHDTRYQNKIETLEQLKEATDDAQRAEILAVSGQWGMAAEAFGKAVRRDPKNRPLRYKQVIALVESGNREGVRLACTELLKNFGDATDPAETTAVAGFCRLAPDAVGNQHKLEALRGLADEPSLRDLLDRQRAQPGADDRALANTLADLGRNLLTQKKWAEAEPIARECLVIREKAQPDMWNTFNAKSMLGGALLGQKKYAEAEPLLLQGYEGMKQREQTIPPVGRPRLPEALERLVQLYEAMGQQPKVAEWRKELEAAKAAQPSTGANHP